MRLSEFLGYRGKKHFSQSHADRARWCNISLLMCNIFSLNRPPNIVTQIKSHYSLCGRHHHNILQTMSLHVCSIYSHIKFIKRDTFYHCVIYV